MKQKQHFLTQFDPLGFNFGQKETLNKRQSEPFSLKMYIGSAKTYDFWMFVCFVFILHKCMPSSDTKRAHHQNIRK